MLTHSRKIQRRRPEKYFPVERSNSDGINVSRVESRSHAKLSNRLVQLRFAKMRVVFLVIVLATLASTQTSVKPKEAARQVTTPPNLVEPSKECVCVIYYQCNPDFSINKYGETIIDIRRNVCGHYLNVCCNKTDITTNSTTSLPPLTSELPPTSQPNPSTDSSPSYQPSVQQTTPDHVTTPTPTSPSVRPDLPRPATTTDRYRSRGCGYRNFNGVGFRIIGGEHSEAQFGEFPWVIAILGDGEEYICGGSLIHPKVVLTSAHCTRGKFIGKLYARAGEWDRGTTKEVLPYQDRKIAEKIEHEDFHSGALLNDIALLILKEPFKLTENVDIICLPTAGYDFDRYNCVASGWGKGNFSSTVNNQVILKKIDLPVVPRDECQSALRTTRLGPYFELHESFTCAGGKKGQDTCYGDGGSPLMCPLKEDPKRYQQAGIVAWGIGCGDTVPGVYASTSFLRPWIDTQFSKQGITVPNT